MQKSISFRGRLSLIAISLFFACALSAVAADAPMQSVLSRDALDLSQCRVLHDGKAGKLDEDRMLFALGALPKIESPWILWSAGAVAGESVKGETFQYQIAFKQPVAIGSVMAASAQRLGFLKPDAPFPGDPANSAHWTTIDMPETAGLKLLTLDKPVQARAVLFTELRRSGTSTLSPIRLFAQRYFNAALMAGARAKTEYQAPENLGGYLRRAIDVVRGRGPWLSTGVNSLGKIPAPEISDVHPQWFVMAWDEPHMVSVIYMQDNFSELKLDIFAGAPGVTPLAGVDAEWKKMDDDQYATAKQQGRWIRFKEPVKTTGLRLRITKALTSNGAATTPVAQIDALLVFEDLGAAPQPAVVTTPPPPPFSLPYTAPFDGLLTMVVDTAQGQRVRNLIAREPRNTGEHRELWDLADEGGKLVTPGTYRWKAITAPPLELRYEMTTYPNVTVLHPENSAWLNGNAGPGGWLADHTPPSGGCASDDNLFFGAPVPESGVGFVCCDLSGKKLWGIHSFSAWSAGTMMATDGKTVFVEHPGAGHYGAADEGADRVWGVDIASHQSRTVLIAQNTEQRRRGISGIAARNGKVVLAINAVDNWIDNACGWAAVDITQCRPSYKVARDPRVPYEIVPDSRNDFLRLLRLKGDPPGYGFPDGQGLIWLESTMGPENRQQIMVAFGKPVPVGSCVFPVPQEKEYQIRLSALKPDAPYPPNPNKKDQWINFETQGSLAWDVAMAPKNTMTRALLITFTKGEDDEVADIMDKEAPAAEPGGNIMDAKPDTELTAGNGAWKGRIEGMKILRRRFQNCFDTATVKVNSGTVDKNGVWDAKRTEALSRSAPAIYMMEWKEPQKLRGLAVKEVDGELTEVDAYVGPKDGAIDLAGTSGWEKVGQFTSRRRMNHSNFAGHNAQARYMDETVDFGKEVVTRAIRLRVVSQFAVSTREGSCAKDLLGIDTARCRIFGVAPLQYVGGEVPVDSIVAERLEVVDGASGKIEKEVAIRKPAALSYAPDGTLYGLADGKILKIDLESGQHQPLERDVKKPGLITFDRQGNLYVYDAAPELRVVRVFDAGGKFLRQFGEPGGYQAGPWNPNRFQSLSAIVVDREGKLWCVDNSYWPKRISCWSPEGKFMREYLGPTAYGSGGVLDPGDRRRMFYGPLEFEIDWKTGSSRLKNLTWTGSAGVGKMFMPSSAGEIPINVNGRTYLVTRTEFAHQPCGIVYLYETDHLKMAAALGAADAFPPLLGIETGPATGGKPLDQFQFIWTDRNGDGEVQFEECVFKPKQIGHLSDFDRKLGILAGATAFDVKEFLPNGVPVYEEKKLPLPVTKTYGDGTIFRLDNGSFYRLGDGPLLPEAGFDAAGKTLWTYKNEGAGVGPDRTCGPYVPEQVVCQFGITGHETAAKGDLGEFFVINANLGSWNIWTADGLLAGRMFSDLRDGKRISWSMEEHGRGMNLDQVTTGQEHFQGWFCRMKDNPADPGQSGKYYAVAGHNHASVVEVMGLDKFKRLGGEFQITQKDIDDAQAWRKELMKFKSRENAKVLGCFSIEGSGLGKVWENMERSQLETDPLNPGRNISFRMCHDAANLYAKFEVRGAGPFKNTGEQVDRLFKTGACVDIMLGIKPEADLKRRAPVEGDKRILVGMFKGAPAVVLYDAAVPGTPREQRWEAVSPVGRTEFDVVRRLDDAVVKHELIIADPANPEKSVVGYTLDITIPFKSIGLDPKTGTRVKFDWGVLETDAQGATVLARSYWSNKTTSTLADAPTEARLEPDLWGWAVFPGLNKQAAKLTDPGALLAPDHNAVEKIELDEP